MHKPIALATSAALLVTGCQSKSLTWHKVMATPRAVGDAERGDRVYAAELHRNLGSTPHKVVTFEVNYFSKLRGSETTQRTAVFYHDEQNQKQPWWVMDSTLDKPVWVPNRPLAEQVSFFARRDAKIVDVHDYTESREKSVQQLELARRPVGTSKLQRVKGGRATPVSRVIYAEPAPAPAPKRKGIKWKFWQKSERKADTTASVETAPKTGTTTLKRVGKDAAKPADPEAIKELDTPKAPGAAQANGVKESSGNEPNLPEKEAPKPAEKPKKVPAAATEKAQPSAPAKVEEKSSAPAKREEKPASKREEKSTTPATAKPAEASAVPKEKKQEPATEPKKRRPLFHRDSPEPATPRPADGAETQPPRRNLFQRILSTINPTRWFRRAA